MASYDKYLTEPTNQGSGGITSQYSYGGTPISQKKYQDLKRIDTLYLAGGLSKNQYNQARGNVLLEPEEVEDPMDIFTKKADALSIIETTRATNPQYAERLIQEYKKVFGEDPTPQQQQVLSNGLPQVGMGEVKPIVDDLLAKARLIENEENLARYKNADLYYKTNGTQGVDPTNPNTRYNPDTKQVGIFKQYGFGDAVGEATLDYGKILTGGTPSPEFAQYAQYNPMGTIGAGAVGSLANIATLGYIPNIRRGFEEWGKIFKPMNLPNQQ